MNGLAQSVLVNFVVTTFWCALCLHFASLRTRKNVPEWYNTRVLSIWYLTCHAAVFIGALFIGK